MIFTLVPTAMAEGEKVAKVGDDEYETLQAAVDAATTENSTVTLLKDVTEDITISTGVTAMLDLSGKTLTNKAGKHTITVENGGKLNISDSVGTGVVDNTSHGKAAIYNKGEVTLNGGTFERSAENGTYSPYSDGGNSWYTIANYGTMEINTGVTVENAGGYSSMIRNGGDVTADCNLTIEGGNFAGGVNTVKNDSFGVLTINGGNFSNTAQYVIMNWNKAEITAGTFQTLDTASAVLFTSAYGADDNTVGKLTISGGEFKHASDTQEMIVDHYDESNSGAAAVTGGRFDADISKYIPSDYVQSADGTVEKLGESNAVAKVGDTYYKTLADAVAAANNATVTLLKDVTANVTIPADKTITLDLNGMTLTNVDDHTILNNGNLTITGTGMVDNISHAKGALYNKGTVVINGGTFDRSQENGMNKGESGQNSWYTIKNVGTMTINDGATVQTAGNNAALGKFSSLVSNGYFNTNDYNTNKGLEQPILTIDGGTFRGGLNTIKNDDRARLTINGGTFSNYYQAVVQNHNIAEITGGTFTAASDANTETYGIYNCGCGADIDLGTLTVSGGTFTGATYAVAEVSSQNAIVNISGGQFAGTKAAIIKSSTSSATIAVSGGSFSQPVKKDYLDSSLNAELKRASGETPYSYYTSMNDALAAAKPGDTVTDLNATTESKVTLTLKYNDGATADTTYNVASGTTITLPTPARIGYTFNGWYDGSTFYAAGASYKVSATVTLNASWSYISSGSSSSYPIYSVSTPSKTENGSVTVSPKSASKGSTVTITVKPDSGYVLETLTVTDKNGNELTLKDKGDGKYTFTMPDSKVTITPTFSKIEDTKPSKNGFDDVASSDWFADAVKYVTDKGLMNGTDDNQFSPNATTTRAMLMTVLARYVGEDTTGGATWYEKGMEWAKAKGVSDGTNPNANITREQLVTMLYRYAGSPKADGKLDSFSDAASVSTYAADAMQWAVANGIVNGSNGKLNPQNNATRAEVAAILMRFCEMSK